jgi:oxygen-independent coproporphyrinogen-3 oxidase
MEKYFNICKAFFKIIKDQHELNQQINSALHNLNRNKITLYVHFPFCLRKCPYCCYYSSGRQPNTIVDKYIDALQKELELLLKNTNFGEAKIGYIYFGGGTPTYLNPHQLNRIINFLREKLNIDNLVGFTCEGSPETIIGKEGEKKLNILLENGVNRLSIGVQSFNDNLLKVIGRAHTSRDAILAYNRARDVGFEDINIDLMFGIPKQTPKKWENDLTLTTKLLPNSVDLFILDIKGTRMEAIFRKEPKSFPPEETNLLMNIMAVEHFTKFGYKFKDPKFLYLPLKQNNFPLHLITTPVIGLGASAFTDLGNLWYCNQRELYENFLKLSRLPVVFHTKLSKRELMEKEVILKLRYFGLKKREFKSKFGIEIENVFGEVLEKLRNLDLIVEDGKVIKLSYLGNLFVFNTFNLFRSNGVGNESFTS